MDDFPLIATVAAGFTAAWVLGLLTQWMRLSPIVGYLLAGVLIGPYTPGFQGDLHLAHQLAEVGVILLMFGVGLHFHLDDLLAVKGVAIPGALGQSLAATLASVVLFSLFGMEPKTVVVIGMAMSVASTVVLMRVLMDADMLNSPAGHAAVGWLLVEDVLTVIVLVMIPVLGDPPTTTAHAAPGAAVHSHAESPPTAAEEAKPAAEAEPEQTKTSPLAAIAIALVKLAALIGIILALGSRVIPWILTQVARLRSRELFTLTVMVFSIAIAAGAYVAFGASMALGAFLAGMVVALSPVSHQAAADALPLRDAFSVLFFVAVGMLFDPMFLIREPLMMLAALVVILLVKPLAALSIVAALGYSSRTALTVALGLAQIGEFSFILSDVARKHGLMSDDGHSMLVGGAILSITLNPMLFRSLDGIERWLRKHPRLWSLLNSRAERRVKEMNVTVGAEMATLAADNRRLAVVVGYGPVGRTVDRLLTNAGLATVIIDLNMDTVAELRRNGQQAIFGDASQEAILESAGVDHATHLILTLPQTTNRADIVSMARNLNPKLKILVRARYLRERGELEQVGATAAIFEEAEAAVALARLVLVDTGAGNDLIEHAVRDIRTRLILDNVSSLRTQAVSQIMIPWTQVSRLSKSASLQEVRRQVSQHHFSRWPVVDDRTGQPAGYLLAKDLIGLDSNQGDWNSVIRPLGNVKPDDDIGSTLQRFQTEGATICAVRERNLPVGIVTIEDILERVVGRIEDEYPRHPRLSLAELLVVDKDLLHLTSASSEQVIVEMTARIPADRLPPEVNLAELVIARERELPTNVGLGVALPHARCPGLTTPAIVFGRAPEGVVFGDESSDRVHLIFLLVTPAEQPDLQVLLLSQVVNIAGNQQKLQSLRAASTADEVRQVFAEE